MWNDKNPHNTPGHAEPIASRAFSSLNMYVPLSPVPSLPYVFVKTQFTVKNCK